MGTIAAGIRENHQELLGVSPGHPRLKKFYATWSILTVVGFRIRLLL